MLKKCVFQLIQSTKKYLTKCHKITLPDGNSLNFENQVTGLEVAEKISKSLAKQAMVISC